MNQSSDDYSTDESSESDNDSSPSLAYIEEKNSKRKKESSNILIQIGNGTYFETTSHVLNITRFSLLVFDPVIIYSIDERGTFNKGISPDFSLRFFKHVVPLFGSYVVYSNNKNHIDNCLTFTEGITVKKNGKFVWEQNYNLINMKNLRRLIYPDVNYPIYVHLGMGCLSTYPSLDFDINIDVTKHLTRDSDRLSIDIFSLLTNLTQEMKDYPFNNLRDQMTNISYVDQI